MPKRKDPQSAAGVPGFLDTLRVNNLVLRRRDTTICQANLGLLCNQACKHCHLDAGPHRKEIMGHDTMKALVDFIERAGMPTLDITGGAPELNPHLPDLMDMAGSLGKKLMLRCNLSALMQAEHRVLKEMMLRFRVNVVASLPSLNLGQTDVQRGKGTFDTSIEALGLLNRMGYGQKDAGLQLDLVSNPSGAFMPNPQAAAEKRFRKILADKWDIRFNNLFTFANMPLGRFKDWLERSGNYHGYLQMLYKGFNPCTVEGLMCRSLVSVSWDGYLYDCDFNQAAGLVMGEGPIHVAQAGQMDFSGRTLAVDNHCYACTAGSGFT